MSRREERSWAFSEGSDLCRECWEAPAEESQPGHWERFRYWLVNGSRAPVTLVCPNGHEWDRSAGVVLFLESRSVPRWIRLPGALFRALLAERQMEPTPLTYLLAGGTGLLLGLVLDLVAGWPWWVVAAGFVVLVWLFFLSSAFRGPGNNLGRRLLRVINPDRAAERDRERLEDALTSGALAGYEIENWEGVKSIGGWSGSPDPDSLTIRHGEFDEQAEWVEVTTHTGAPEVAGGWIQEELDSRLIKAQFPLPDEPTIEDFRQRQQNIRKAEPPYWQPTSFRVDNEVVRGQISKAGSRWVAFLAAGSVLVDMTGSGVDADQIRLVRIRTLEDFSMKGS